MKCQNCGISKNLFSFIKFVDPTLYRQYVLETFANKTIFIPSDKSIVIPKENPPEIPLESLDVLPSNHWCLEYIRHRKIPKKFWKELFFTPNFAEFINFMKITDKKNDPNDARLIIPIYDEKFNLQAINARALNTNGIRYLSRKFSDDAVKLYGLHRVDKSQKIYCFEGPIDSMFVHNSVATCDSDLLRSAKYLPKENLILVFDNQYHNSDIRRSIKNAIDANFDICIFPKHLQEKDVNEMIMKGYSENDVKQIIDDNTFKNLRATLELRDR